MILSDLWNYCAMGNSRTHSTMMTSERGGVCFQVLYEMFTCVFWRPLLVRWERWVLHVNILCVVVSGDIRYWGGGGGCYFRSGGVDSLWNECHKYYIFSFTLQLWNCWLNGFFHNLWQRNETHWYYRRSMLSYRGMFLMSYDHTFIEIIMYILFKLLILYG